jgi:hypothetical protein
MKDDQDRADARRHAAAATNLPKRSLDGIGVSMVDGADDGKENEWCGRFGDGDGKFWCVDGRFLTAQKAVGSNKLPEDG